MYPFIKLLIVIVKSRFRSRLNLSESCSLEFRAGIMDIDLFLELNNARYMTLMELGRWDFSARTGFLNLMRKNKWSVVIGGASIRYRRRIPFMSKFQVTTKLICHDGRWVYFLQEFHRNDQICASGLLKAGVTSKAGLVPAPIIAKALGEENWGEIVPEWVAAWIEAEGKRPWPNSELRN